LNEAEPMSLYFLRDERVDCIKKVKILKIKKSIGKEDK